MRLFTLAILLPLTVLSFSVSAAASETTRSDFLTALHAAKKGQPDTKSAKVEALRDYPLYNYLIAAQLRHELNVHPSAAVDKKIAKFVTDNPHLPPATRLRGAWLKSLTKRQHWSQVIKYTQDSDGTTAQCRAVHAAIELGQSPTSRALTLYTVGKSQPSACDPVFAWLADSGHLTNRVIRQRAHKAILNGQPGLAHYLAKKLSGADKVVVDNWVTLARNPTRLADASANLDGDIAIYVFKRLALRGEDQAGALIKPLVARLGLNEAQRYQMQRYVALLYAENHRPQALLWFARTDHDQMQGDDHALGWEVRAAIYQQRWPLVLDAIGSMSASMANDEEWQYWKARALAETGHEKQAKVIYTKLASHRSYHGYLAADALGQSYQFNERPLPKDKTALAQIEAMSALARARELHALKMKHYAYLEWRALTARLDKAQLAQAAKLAYQWGWYARAIVTLAKSGYWDDLDIRYPTPYRSEVKNSAAQNDLDPAYVYAIMRTESLFQPTVASPAGAHGLMQLMPGTARHLARQLGESAPSTSQLNTPAVNIRLGSRYLRDMLNNWSGNIALSTASYNAGPNKIAQWLPDDTTPPDIWISNIAYTETRKYVKNVMSHMTVFQHRLHETVVPLDQRIKAIRPDYPDQNKTTF